jgi:hypothetical protein
VIEATHFVAEDGRIMWRARGVVRQSLVELAEALGVSESEFRPTVDPVQYAQEQKRLQRLRRQGQRARGVDFDPF